MNEKVKVGVSDESWLDEARNVDQATVETSGPEYPYIQWVNGQPTLKQAGGVAYTGGWFAQAEQFDGELPGWTAGTLVHRDSSETAGFFKRDIEIAVIHWRRCWIVGQDGKSLTFAWANYDQAKGAGKPTGRLHVLALVRGLESQGPLVLTMKGLVGATFTGSRKELGVLGEFNRFVIRPANSINVRRGLKAKWPYRAFWLCVGPDRDDKGAPTFSKVGQGDSTSLVTLPVALGLPEHADTVALQKLFVGGELLRTLNDFYRETEEWARAWDTIKAQTVTPGSEPDDVPPAEFPEETEPIPF